MADNIYNPEFVKGMFNRMSGTYEKMNYITSFGFSARWRRQFLKPFAGTKDKVRIIDLMTGMGETWHSVTHKFPGAQLSALDFSGEMLKRAGRKNTKHFDEKIELLQQDILQNGLPGEHYDFVISAFGLKTFDEEQLRIIARETKRILKKGGQFSFIEISRPDNGFLKVCYRFYIKRAIPLLGRLLLADPKEYKMLWRYTNVFENARKAAAIFASEGLEVQFNSYFYGCATGFSGRKN